MNPSTAQTPLPAAAPAPAPTPAQAAGPTVPEGNWPGAFKIFSLSKNAVFVNLKTVLIFYAITIVIAGVSVFIKNQALNQSFSLVNNLLSGVLYVVLLAGVRQQKIEILDALKQFFVGGLWWRFIVTYLIAAVMLIISLILLIVPFFLLLPRLAFIAYFIIDKKAGPVEAIKLSLAVTKGHSGKVWGIIGANIVFALPALTIIGIPVSIYLYFVYAAATAILYQFVIGGTTAQPEATASAPVAPTVAPTPVLTPEPVQQAAQPATPAFSAPTPAAPAAPVRPDVTPPPTTPAAV